MLTQKEKYHTAMSGEYLVAAHLQRMNITASITYGNAKKADIIALSEDNRRCVLIEVKTSSKGRWPIGGRVPNPSDNPWIFVHMPENINEPAEFFIMSQNEIYSELKLSEDEYLERYKIKHGHDYGNKPGVASMKKSIAEKYKDNWSTILNLIR
ncbi:MAG: hypothetical protein RBT49_06865 [Bacteroidales bacterium]|nr:hypothetical protein [Bacteroidales bacterium]